MLAAARKQSVSLVVLTNQSQSRMLHVIHTIPIGKSASKIGSGMSFSAPWTTRSRIAGIERMRTFLPPSFGISFFRAGMGRYVLLTKRLSTDGGGRMHSKGKKTSVSKAKKAIFLYRNALGDPVGVAELLVFYCERAAGFCQEVDHRDAAYLDALVQMFEQALKAASNQTGKAQTGFLARLDRVRRIVRQLGNGVDGRMDILFSEFDLSIRTRANSGKQDI